MLCFFNLWPISNSIYPDPGNRSLANSSTPIREGAAVNDIPVQGKSMEHLDLIIPLRLHIFICIYICFHIKAVSLVSYNYSRGRRDFQMILHFFFNCLDVFLLCKWPLIIGPLPNNPLWLQFWLLTCSLSPCGKWSLPFQMPQIWKNRITKFIESHLEVILWPNLMLHI